MFAPPPCINVPISEWFRKKKFLLCLLISAIPLLAGVFMATLGISDIRLWGVLGSCVLTILFIFTFILLGMCRQENVNHRLQTEAALALYASLRPQGPIPPMGGSTASADVSRILAMYVFDKKPRCVLELGSGVSTLWMALAMRQQEHGRIISLDHEAEFAAITSSQLQSHGLAAYAEIIHAPLEYSKAGYWYRMKEVDISPRQVDMLFIDGPPAYKRDHKHARYPALDILKPYLAQGCLIAVDDAGRKGQIEVCREWEKNFPLKQLHPTLTEKGLKLYEWNA